jgi:hypothetical protein
MITCETCKMDYVLESELKCSVCGHQWKGDISLTELRACQRRLEHFISVESDRVEYATSLQLRILLKSLSKESLTEEEAEILEKMKEQLALIAHQGDTV